MSIRVAVNFRVTRVVVLFSVLAGLNGAIPLAAGIAEPPMAIEGPGSLWQTFGGREGLSSSNVYTIVLAPDGRPWVGTDRGVSLYDGRTWSSIGELDGLPSGRVRAIAQADDGSVWIGTRLGGIAHIAAGGECCEVWTTADGLPSNDVRFILPAATVTGDARRAGLWVATDAGLAYLDGSGAVVEQQLSGFELWTLQAASGGALLVGTAGRGVWQRDSWGDWQQLGDNQPQGDVYALWSGSDGVVWAGTNHGLFAYSGGEWQPVPLLEDDTSLLVLDIAADGEGGLWLATSQGCFLLHSDDPGHSSTRYLVENSGLANNYVRALAIDSDGALWLGTLAGVNRFAASTWQPVQAEPLAAERINALLTDRQGRTWAGTEYAGLVMWGGSAWQQIKTAGDTPLSDRVTSLFQDATGRIWVGGSSDQVCVYDVDSTWRCFQDATGIAGQAVLAFAQDIEGRVWLATTGGVTRWDELSGFAVMPELIGKRINAICADDEGGLVFGTEADGVLLLDEGQWQSVPLPNGATFHNIVAGGIVQDSSGVLWVGTYDEGLWRRIDDRWEQIDTALVSPLVLSVQMVDGQLWIGTRVGLARYDGTSWQTYSGEALPGSDVLAIAPAAGEGIWLGTGEGLVRYRPEHTSPWVRITSVNLMEPQAGAVTLESDVLREIRVSGGDLATRPENLAYLIQLGGLDETWHAYSSEQIAAYADMRLPSGTYRLRVRARDTAMNYSSVAEVAIVTPRVMHLPGGRIVSAPAFYAILGGGAVAIASLAIAGILLARAAVDNRRRKGERVLRQKEALERQFNPYISGEPVRNPEMFFGRQALLLRILSALHQNSILILGERRMGKTTLLYQLGELLRHIEDSNWVFIPVAVDLEGTPQDRFFYNLMDSIRGVLSAYLTQGTATLRWEELTPLEYGDRDFTADLKFLIDTLRDKVWPRNLRVVLLMDEMDVISSYDPLTQLQLRRIFMSSLAQNMGAVAAGTELREKWERVESPWFNMFNQMEIEQFKDEDAHALLEEPVRDIYEWDPRATDFVVAMAEGRPYRLQKYAFESVNRMLTDGRLRITIADVRAAYEDIERAGARRNGIAAEPASTGGEESEEAPEPGF